MDARPRDGRLGSRSLILVALAMTAAGASCAGGSGGTTGTGGSTGTGTGGTTSTGGSTGTGGTGTGTGGSSSGTGGTNGGTGGTTSTGGVTGTGGTTSTGGATGTGGTSAGTGGAAGAHGTGGTTGTGGASSTGGTTGSGGSTGTAGASGCPSNATFCSGFETAGQPAGSVYMVNAAPGDWSRDFAIDTSQAHAGNSSLLVKAESVAGSSGSAYRMLAVPATPNAFWVRFWIMGASALGGDSSHNAYAGGSIGDSPSDLMIEFAEDVGIAFNTSDSDQWPTGYGRLSGGGTNPYVLPAMTWECVEISYDGTGKEQQLFINNTQLIDAKGYPANTEALTYFKFGYDGYNKTDGGSIWYDDVAVAPTRIGGCPTVTKSNQ